MSATKPITPKLSTKTLQRTIWLVGIVLVLVVLSFGGYYYWDRYIHLGDKSPLEVDIAHLEQAIRDDPQNPDARVALAEYYLTKGMYPDAIEQANQVLNAYPDNQGAMLVAGVAAVRMNKPEEALEPLEKFVALRKDGPMANTDTALETAYYFLGESYMALDRPQDAIPVLEGALVINRTDADALYLLGQAYQATGRPEDALQQYQKAVRLVPDFTEAYTAMIEAYSTLNQEDYVAYARGMQAFTLKDYQTARTHLEYATNALPDFAPAFLGLALTYEKLGQPQAALQAVDRALDLDPTDFAAQQAYGRLQSILNPQE
ncbi:MAG: tetratricopeptide repeat protein [Caldilineae bacterium]|nr:MAG: tetratricopeptide repeat protein [Caldilineae bacterium]